MSIVRGWQSGKQRDESAWNAEKSRFYALFLTCRDIGNKRFLRNVRAAARPRVPFGAEHRNSDEAKQHGGRLWNEPDSLLPVSFRLVRSLPAWLFGTD